MINKGDQHSKYMKPTMVSIEGKRTLVPIHNNMVRVMVHVEFNQTQTNGGYISIHFMMTKIALKYSSLIYTTDLLVTIWIIRVTTIIIEVLETQ